MPNRFLVFAALNGFIVVTLGAFGAHALEARLSVDMLAVWQTGVQYQMFHVAGLVAVHLLQQSAGAKTASSAGWCFVGGILVFSGSLYLLALSGLTWLGMITPLGGLAFLAGWVQLARAALQEHKP
jgi:uncharacterized membrane protein YgdD (TMEM256/DUF423 family)